MLKSSHNKFFGLETPWDTAKTVLFGAPYDSTTSFRPGARFGPAAMRGESFGLESYSPYQDKDLYDCDDILFDSGDLELPFGSPEPALALIEEQTDAILSAGKRPLMLGGEHLVTLGAVRAAARHYPDLCLIHFDAHTDLRQDYLGSTLSHATVIRRCWDLLGDNRIYQFGIRSGEKTEFMWGQAHTHLQKFDFTGLTEAVATLAGKPVYFTVDLDVLDPSTFPGTGTPEAGGVDFSSLLAAFQSVGQLNIVGCDLVELAPIYDPSGRSTAIACKLLRELLLALC